MSTWLGELNPDPAAVLPQLKFISKRIAKQRPPPCDAVVAPRSSGSGYNINRVRGADLWAEFFLAVNYFGVAH